ncbi:SGNH/GDSL hydrolase family protein [Chitinophaga caseinilytica]|jgi:lysophospholipase L1-like esterase|uniref:SGNH/GDSL hydrolase family protein n=1 Tax=Chitinophaga caseinilytica TaxID=2267521 RepID=A0ABZ2Z6J9_9BACT
MKYSTLMATGLLLALGASAQQIDSSYANDYYKGRMALFATFPQQRGAIVFLGNSITERGAWHELLPGKKTVNRGIGGDNTFGVLARLNDVIASRPAKLFLLIGINDLGRGLPESVILSNYRRILERLRSGAPKTKIYVQSVLPMHESKLPDYLKNKAEKVKSLNVGIAALAKEFGLPFLNLHEWAADAQGELKSDYTVDGIHLTPPAYAAWVAWLKGQKVL